MSYDGHGRVYQSHKPEQRDSSNNLKYTTYSYNLDDSILSVTDGRGAVTNLTYNNRGLLTEKSWTIPSGSGITDPADVTFSYDNLGNRTAMTDGLGSVAYEYDSLSRLATEKRDFTDTLPNSPISGGQYELEYTYTLAGQLKSYTDAFGKTISYAQDKVGRLSTVTGTGSVTYASNPHYRAWGALSHLEYGNGTEMNVGSFNNKLQATTFEIKKGTTSIINKSYDFHTDGSLKSETDANNAKFDRLFVNDFADRLSIAKSGAEARGSTDSAVNIPFGNTYQYNSFNNITQRVGKHFDSGTATTNRTFENNRFTGSYWSSGGYDANGNQLKDADSGWKTYKYDAAGRLASSHYDDYNADPVEDHDETFIHDGDGRMVKIATVITPDGGTQLNGSTYRIRSSVLGGQIVTEVSSDGSRERTNILAGSSHVATHTAGNVVYWHHADPSGSSIRTTDSSGDVFGTGDSSDYRDKQELDADGKGLGFSSPYEGGIPDPTGSMFEIGQAYSMRIRGQTTTFFIDGIQMPVEYALERSGESLVRVSEVTGLHTTRVRNQDGTPGRRISSRGFIVNAGFGAGMVPASWLDDMGMLSFSGTSSQVAAAGGGANFANQSLNPLSSEAFNDIEDAGDTSTVTGWGGDSAKAWVNISLGLDSGIDPELEALLRQMAGPPAGPDANFDWDGLFKLLTTPIWCKPDVIAAMKVAWSRTGNGLVGNEAGFVLNGNHVNYKIVETKSGNTRGYQQMTITIGGDAPTFLLFHVHPTNGSSGNPSTPKNNKLNNDKGDTGIADERTLLFLIGHRTGLRMYDPKTKAITLLRENIDWTEPCD